MPVSSVFEYVHMPEGLFDCQLLPPQDSNEVKMIELETSHIICIEVKI